jgi:glycosyltransferase 2 family protein
MNRKHTLTVLVIAAILAVLFYFQFRQYKEFPWGRFKEVSSSLFSDPRRLARILTATGLIYITYWFRAIRWKLFLRPIKDVSVASVVPAQFIGFTGLSLLGRPGEFSRPYLIAKRHNLSFASQLAIWSVERLFDMGAFAVLFGIALIRLAPELQSMAHGELVKLQEGSYILIGGIACAALGVFLLRTQRERFSRWVETRLPPGKLGHGIGRKLVAFADGLDTIHDLRSFIQIALLSLVTWFVIALSYLEVLHAYPGAVLGNISFRAVFVIMAGSMIGSLLQLPAVGGGSQLGTITVMNRVLGVNETYATSAGIILWLVTFASVIPAGLILAHRERISLRKLSEESETKAEMETA